MTCPDITPRRVRRLAESRAAAFSGLFPILISPPQLARLAPRRCRPGQQSFSTILDTAQSLSVPGRTLGLLNRLVKGGVGALRLSGRIGDVQIAFNRRAMQKPVPEASTGKRRAVTRRCKFPYLLFYHTKLT